jgi:hypothetical protein
MTTTRHPERRAGQRWRAEFHTDRDWQCDYTLTKRNEDDNMWFATSDSGIENCNLLDGMWTDDHGFFTMTLLSDVPAAAPLAADRTKCRWYCGMTMNAIYEDDRQVILGEKFHAYDPRTNADQRWCSPACRDARLPPLAAQPAETKRLGCEYSQVCGDGSYLCGHHRRTDEASQPAPQPAPAKPEQRCMWKHATTPCAGPFAERYVGMAGKRESHGWCEGHYLEYERQAYARPASGTPYTGPERLERPRLAHSSTWADEAEDVR